ncbi:MAG TPA: recombinase family protein [Terriglobales bacterium]|nr:recombinase family protein [Terriglobales bacterium]
MPVDPRQVWKLDRFARSLKHLVNALAEFEALGVAFVSLGDNLDLSTPAGRLMFQIINAGGVRACADPGKGKGRVAECTRQGTATGPAGPCECGKGPAAARSGT